MKHQPSDEVQIFINKIFENIENSKTLKELREIGKECIEEKYKMDIGKYPKINFDISRDEIAELIKEEIIVHSTEGYFLKDDAINELPPIARLLYSVLWKNGDLRKLNHIIQGINEGDEETEKVDGLVFYQFGKYLANKSEPIIDQHVIRAFAVYRPINNESVDELRKMNVINKKHLNYIRNYKDWFSKLPNQMKQIPEASYYIDKLLFAAGKSIKL